MDGRIAEEHAKTRITDSSVNVLQKDILFKLNKTAISSVLPSLPAFTRDGTPVQSSTQSIHCPNRMAFWMVGRNWGPRKRPTLTEARRAMKSIDFIQMPTYGISP